MRYRNIAAVAVAVGALPSIVRAQCQGNADPIGSLGITQIECDCVIAPVTRNTQWRFFTEPKVLRIQPGGPADGKLQVGDVILKINGQDVTSQTGAELLARPRPGRNFVLTVRRDGTTASVAVTSASACPGDTRLLGFAPAVQARAIPAAAPVQRRGAASIAPAPFSSTAWIGLAFSCNDCTYNPAERYWTFRTPPEVYTVETGSPAYAAGMRRGDVLTHVDDLSITTMEGGRRWSSVKPAETIRLRYRRGDATRQASVRAASPRGQQVQARSADVADQLASVQQALAARDTVTSQLMRQYQESLTKQEAELQRLLQQVRDRDLTDAERVQLEASLRRYAQQNEVLRTQQQQQLQDAMRQMQASSRQEEEALQALIATAQRNVVIARSSGTADQVRYSSTIAGTEVEVRGSNPVIVSEDGNELTIRLVDGTTVRLRVRR